MANPYAGGLFQGVMGGLQMANQKASLDAQREEVAYRREQDALSRQDRLAARAEEARRWDTDFASKQERWKVEDEQWNKSYTLQEAANRAAAEANRLRAEGQKIQNRVLLQQATQLETQQAALKGITALTNPIVNQMLENPDFMNRVIDLDAVLEGKAPKYLSKTAPVNNVGLTGPGAFRPESIDPTAQDPFAQYMGTIQALFPREFRKGTGHPIDSGAAAAYGIPKGAIVTDKQLVGIHVDEANDVFYPDLLITATDPRTGQNYRYRSTTTEGRTSSLDDPPKGIPIDAAKKRLMLAASMALKFQQESPENPAAARDAHLQELLSIAAANGADQRLLQLVVSGDPTRQMTPSDVTRHAVTLASSGTYPGTLADAAREVSEVSGIRSPQSVSPPPGGLGIGGAGGGGGQGDPFASLPPDVIAKVQKARENGYTDEDIMASLKEEGYIQ